MKTKTELTGLAIALVTFLEQMGLLSRFDPQDVQSVLVGLLGIGLVFLRRGVAKAERAANGRLKPMEKS